MHVRHAYERINRISRMQHVKQLLSCRLSVNQSVAITFDEQINVVDMITVSEVSFHETNIILTLSNRVDGNHRR